MTPLLNVLPVGCGCGCNNCGDSGDGTLGSLSSDLIGAGVAAAGALKGLFSGGSSGECAPPGGCFNCRIKGQGGIAGCFNDLWLNQIPAMKAAVASGQVTQQQYIATLRQTLAAIGNDQLFTPQTDAYLINTKTGIQNEIDAATAAMSGQTTPQTGSIAAPAAGAQTIFGMPLATVLLLAGGGLVAFSLLRQD